FAFTGQEGRTEHAPMDSHRNRIVVAEDDPTTCGLLEAFFDRKAWDVTVPRRSSTATNGCSPRPTFSYSTRTCRTGLARGYCFTSYFQYTTILSAMAVSATRKPLVLTEIG